MTTMPAFPHQFQNLSLRSSVRTSSSTRLRIHSNWMNQSGPMPLKDHMIYRANPVTLMSSSFIATAVLKYPTIQWKTKRPIVAGTSSFRVRAPNHLPADCFCSAYRALMPASRNNSGMNHG